MTSPTPDLVTNLAPQDFVPTYTLLDRVEATIPTSAQPDEPGVHWVARGLLVETCARLLGHPVSLDCFERPYITFVSVIVSLASTVLSRDPRDVLLGVQLVLDRRTGRWVLIFRDRVIATGGCLPSPNYLAELVAVDYDRGRRPLDDSQGLEGWPQPLW